jgi:hypothetical protein
MRTSLLNDASYEWSVTEPSVNEPHYGLRFSRDEKFAVVFFDAEVSTIQIACSSKAAKLTKKTADGWRAYLERQIHADRTLTARSFP